jgi:hypothetical protein
LNYGTGIALDSAGNAYVTGTTTSDNFPNVNPLQASRRGQQSAFVTKINPAGSALVYSTYLGGGADFGNAIAVDGSGNVYVTGCLLARRGLDAGITVPGLRQILGRGIHGL